MRAREWAAAEVAALRTVGHDGVVQDDGTVVDVADTAARNAGGVTAERTVEQCRGAHVDAVVDAAPDTGRVAKESAILRRQRCEIIDAAAEVRGRVPRNRGVEQSERALVGDAAASVGRPVANRQAGNGGRHTAVNCKDSANVAAADSDGARSQAADGEVLCQL